MDIYRSRHQYLMKQLCHLSAAPVSVCVTMAIQTTPLLLTLPCELFLLLTDRLRLGDLYVLAVTCTAIAAAVEPLLYERAVKDDIADKRFYHAAINGNEAAVLKFFKAGVSLAAFKEYKESLWLLAHGRETGGNCRSLTKRLILNSTVHPLLAAAALGHVNVVKTLSLQEKEEGMNVDFKDNYERPALCYAIE
jgi:hypothetical protein